MFDFKNSPLFAAASRTKRKMSVTILILVLILLFYISQLLASMPVGVVAALVSLDEVYELAGKTDPPSVTVEEFQEILLQAVQTDEVTLTMLFSTVFTIILCIIWCKLIEKRSLYSMGFVKRRGFLHYILGLAVGLVLFSAVYFICVATGAATFVGLNPSVNITTLLLFFFAFLVQGASEEILMRGFFMISAKNSTSLFSAIATSSILFATLHISNSGINGLAIINLALFGVFASLYMLRTGNIWGVSAIHAIWNFAQGNLFGCLVSGMNVNSTLITTEINADRTLTNGGEFGPEGGVVVTLVLLIAIILVVYLPSKTAKSAPATEQIPNEE